MTKMPGLALIVVGLLDAGLPDAGAQPANPSRDVPAGWESKAERTGFRETARYDEISAYCDRLAASSDWIQRQSFGTSPEGRDLTLLVASKNGAFTPHAARRADRVIVLVQNCIHAGECAGKDASLMLLRDIAISKTRADLLDNLVLLVMPIFNVDGHERFSRFSRINQNGPEEMGWRVTSRNLNLNRDYSKADTVEMRAWLDVWNAWRPDFHFDNHSTDGGDWQYDLMYAADTHAIAAPQIADWLDNTLLPRILPELEADGHKTIVYFSRLDPTDPRKGIRAGGFGPRYSTGYCAIRNRPSILVETHAIKPYGTRVFGHYNIMRRTLEELNRNPEALRTAVRAADEATMALGAGYDPERKLPLAVGHKEDAEQINFKGVAYRTELSDISGEVRIIYDGDTPIEFPTEWHNKLEVTRSVTPPLAYIIPPQWTEVIDLMHQHGLRTKALASTMAIEVESYRFEDVSFASRPFEGRFEPRHTIVPVTEQRTFPAGSIVVPLDQCDAKVAIFLLEPDAPDSLLSWGFFNAIFEQKEYGEHYVLEDVARKMLAAAPDLRVEFEEKVRTDRKFAADPRARLNFFYQRSPYWDDHMNRYPVGRLIRRLPPEALADNPPAQQEP